MRALTLEAASHIALAPEKQVGGRGEEEGDREGNTKGERVKKKEMKHRK